MKRALFLRTSLAFGLLVAELAGHAALALRAGDVSVRDERLALLAEDDGTPAPIVAGARNRTSVVLHPYLGSVRDLGVLEGGHGIESRFLRESATNDTFMVLLTGGSVAVNFALDMRKYLTGRLATLPGVVGRKVVIAAATMGG
jgi:hypothetical protein